jgi:hypothetical protein
VYCACRSTFDKHFLGRRTYALQSFRLCYETSLICWHPDLRLVMAIHRAPYNSDPGPRNSHLFGPPMKHLPRERFNVDPYIKQAAASWLLTHDTDSSTPGYKPWCHMLKCQLRLRGCLVCTVYCPM